MEQLILHLFGDYITQTDWMARNKTNKPFPAIVHAVIYTIPFMLLTTSIAALGVIMYTHLMIDHYRLARYIVFAKNWITDSSIRWDECNKTGYPENVPVWMATWLLIIADNTMHLAINYAALRWL